MIEKDLLCANRIRKITGSFAFIEHRFLRDGFWASLGHHELLVYFFLVIVANRRGLSYYSYDKIYIFCRISVDEYIMARDMLIEKDLIAFDGRMFQVLALSERAVPCPVNLLKTKEAMEQHDPATVHQLIAHAFGGHHD